MEMVQQGGSDLLIGANYRPAMRRFGQLVPLGNHPPLATEHLDAILAQVLSESELEVFRQEMDMDFAYQIELPGGGGFCRFRANAFTQRFGPSMVFRSIPRQIPSLAQLNLPEALGRNLMEFHQGLVLVTGPTGSGKTSTLAALIDYANQSRPLNIITLEDPIEYVHHANKSLVVQRQVGMHVDTYANALRAALREDPDLILVGELRDVETISLCITAAETGHLVLGTMNTISAAQTVGRLVNAFPPRQQSQIRMMVADSLRGVISQQLLPRRDGMGRIVAVEVLLATSALANLIRENKMHQVNSVIQTASKKGMMMMDNSLLELVRGGIVDPGEAIDRAHDKNSFVERVYAVGGNV
ncbi:MAG: PilT/PilU family type 4a pilus ATPase [Armatimonadetes bacterium]|nr:PilT/PilU family type 4a pilus ATPase [Armatimonadota bacterium]